MELTNSVYGRRWLDLHTGRTAPKDVLASITDPPATIALCHINPSFPIRWPQMCTHAACVNVQRCIPTVHSCVILFPAQSAP